MRHQQGFTLVELMIAVGIVGVLAMIAVPSYETVQLRAKRSELPTNMAAIRTVEHAYFAEWGDFVYAGDTPAAVPGTSQASFLSGDFAQFQKLGWVPDDRIRGCYRVDPDEDGDPSDFLLVARCDVDGVGAEAVYQATRHQQPRMITPNDVY